MENLLSIFFYHWARRARNFRIFQENYTILFRETQPNPAAQTMQFCNVLPDAVSFFIIDIIRVLHYNIIKIEVSTLLGRVHFSFFGRDG